MAIYSASLSLLNTTGINLPVFDIETGATQQQAKVIELGIQINVATNSYYGIGYTTNTPVQIGPYSLLAEDPTNTIASKTTIGLAWSTAPVAPAKYLRRPNILAASIGQSFIMTWPRGLGIETQDLGCWALLGSNATSAIMWAVVME